RIGVLEVDPLLARLARDRGPRPPLVLGRADDDLRRRDGLVARLLERGLCLRRVLRDDHDVAGAAHGVAAERADRDARVRDRLERLRERARRVLDLDGELLTDLVGHATPFRGDDYKLRRGSTDRGQARRTTRRPRGAAGTRPPRARAALAARSRC